MPKVEGMWDKLTPEQHEALAARKFSMYMISADPELHGQDKVTDAILFEVGTPLNSDTFNGYTLGSARMWVEFLANKDREGVDEEYIKREVEEALKS